MPLVFNYVPKWRMLTLDFEIIVTIFIFRWMNNMSEIENISYIEIWLHKRHIALDMNK